MTLEAMRPAGSSDTDDDVATSTLSAGGPNDGVCGSGDAGSCECDVISGAVYRARLKGGPKVA